MTVEEKPSPPPAKPIVLRPWLVVAAALLFYLLTLNHWVTLSSLPIVAPITGWNWHPLPLSWRPEPMRPLFLILTCPVRLLPAAWQPLSLNLLSAVWAALTLGLLAASVRLLPHDRTRDQRQREQGEFGLLSARMAFLPALFAALILAGQITFWQNAVAASNEMLDLLIFALVIFCLLRYRIGQNDKWLEAMAFLYGLGVTNNWALIGFFPLFLIAVVWIKGAGFFNGQFVARMIGFGAAGLLLYLLIPFLGSMGVDHENFWSLLHQEWGAQRFALRVVPRWMVMLAALSTVLPLVFAGVKWPSYEGEISQGGNILIRLVLRLLHAVFLALPLLIFFDFKYSPGLRMREMPVAWLSFYYVGALAVGYFSGYLLLLFGREPASDAGQPPAPSNALDAAVLTLVCVLAVAAPVCLFWQHWPRIRAGNSGILAQFSDEMLNGLPPNGALVLSDDSERLFLLEAARQRRHAPGQNILIETSSLPHREYLRYLASRYPELQKLASAAGPRQTLSGEALVKFLLEASQHQPIYYLHPSFGYFFETFYLKPHGVVFELKSFPTAAAQAPLLSAAEIAANEAFWTGLKNGPLQSLPALAKKDGSAQVVAADYSVALDFWGVELQRANRLKEANASFAEAIRLKPDNIIVGINLEYNNHLQKGDRRPINSTEPLHRALRFYGDLTRIIIFNGPIDEPDLDSQFGQVLAESKDFRQATALLERRMELLPGDPAANLDMAKTYVDRGQGNKALDALRGMSAASKARINPWEMARIEALAHVANKEYSVAEKIFRDAVQASPRDPARIATLAEFYRVAGDAGLRQNKEFEARQYLNNALTNLNLELEILSVPSESESANRDILEVLLKKGEVQMLLKSYDAVVASMNEFLRLQPSNPTAILIRALAEVKLKNAPAARNDYKSLRRFLPNEPYVIDYGLAEVAAIEKNGAEEIRCLRRYLQSAPEDSPGYGQVKERLQKLEGR
jgi:predicted Zn-dependent protease